MTKKEYEQDIQILSEKIRELIKENESLKVDKSEHELLLQNYYHVSSQLLNEQTACMNYENKIRSLEKTLERYEKMLDRVTFNA